MSSDYVKELSKLGKHYSLHIGIFNSNSYIRIHIFLGEEIPSRICNNASTLELLSSISERESWSSAEEELSVAGAIRLFSAEGSSVRHIGHLACVLMTVSIQF